MIIEKSTNEQIETCLDTRGEIRNQVANLVRLSDTEIESGTDQFVHWWKSRSEDCSNYKMATTS